MFGGCLQIIKDHFSIKLGCPSCKKMVDFQIASDLHIELKGGLRASASAFPEPHSELLILAGDVYNAGAPEFPEILRRASEGFQLTLFVPGNHEFYGLSGSFPGIEKMIAERVNSLPNVYCLNNSSITVGGLTFVGATMWTDPPKEQWEYGKAFMNDYHLIKNEAGGAIDVADTVRAHTRQAAWISRSVKKAAKIGRTRGAVIVTHHAPAAALSQGGESPRNRAEELAAYYYASDVDAISKNSFVKLWVYGHTHQSRVDRPYAGGAVFATNAMGYNGERTGYTHRGILHID